MVSELGFSMQRQAFYQKKQTFERKTNLFAPTFNILTGKPLNNIPHLHFRLHNPHTRALFLIRSRFRLQGGKVSKSFHFIFLNLPGCTFHSVTGGTFNPLLSTTPPQGVAAPEVLGSIANSRQLVSNTLMRTTIIIIVDEARDAFTQGIRIILGIDIDVFLLDRMPEPLYPDVVLAASFTIHADLDSKPAQGRFPFGTGILNSLIGVDDFRHSMSCDTFFDKRNTVACGE